MKTFKFKTNINCSACVAKVKPFLESEKNISQWDVEITNPDKILTISTEVLDKDNVKSLVEKAGFVIKGEV